MSYITVKSIKRKQKRLKVKLLVILSRRFYFKIKQSDLNDLENLYKNIQNEISTRLDENILSSSQKMKSFETEIVRILEKKANLYDVTSMLNNKADATTTNMSLQSKVIPNYHIGFAARI